MQSEIAAPIVTRATTPRSLVRALIFSQALAVLWWLVALWLRANSPTPVWHDQQFTFLQLGAHILDPYSVPGFVNPPWTAIPLALFGLFSLPVATLIQSCLYFAILTGIIFKFARDKERDTVRMVLIALTSFIALDGVIELNIDWLVALGLLVPALWSGLFLLVKPQDALGYLISLKRREFIGAVAVMIVGLLVSLVVWGMWPPRMWQAIQQNSLGHFYNLAPLALLPVPIALAIGLLIGWQAFKKRDPALAVLAWLFFVPYITLYSLVLPFALLTTRYPRFALLISVVVWIVYGGTLARYFLHF